MPDALLLQSDNYNILIEQGQQFYRVIKIKNNNVYTDLLTYTFKAEIREKESIESALIATIQCNVSSLEPTELILSIADTSNIRPNLKGLIPNNFYKISPNSLPNNVYHWSLRAFVGASPVSRIVKGVCLVSPEITSA